MKIEYDPQHDIMNIELISDAEIEESVEIDGVIIDYTKERKIASLEILDAGKRVKPDILEKINLVILKSEAEV